MSGKTIENLEELANAGNVEAIQELGVRYYKGIGVDVDYVKAKGYFETANVAGSPDSSYYLGLIYYNGNGTGIDYNKAKEYFEKSDSNGNIFSSYYLGKLYYWGDGIGKNSAKAYEYKSKILATPFFTNQKASDSDFYSVVDIEAASINYANAVQNKIQTEFKSLYGNTTTKVGTDVTGIGVTNTTFTGTTATNN